MKYNEKVDVWSYGLVLWELATHKMPYSDHEKYSNASAYEVMKAIATQDLVPTVPTMMPSPAITSIFSQCCRFEPHVRATMEDVLLMLKGVEESGKLNEMETSLRRSALQVSRLKNTSSRRSTSASMTSQPTGASMTSQRTN